MHGKVSLRCPQCGRWDDVPADLPTWVCPQCGKDMRGDFQKAIKAAKRWEKRKQRWDKQDQRIADRKAEEERRAEQQRRAFSVAHRTDSERIIDFIKELTQNCNFPYRYRIPYTYPTKEQALLLITESVATLPFEESGGGMNWQDCSLRRWLNNDFLNSLPSAVRNCIVCESRECTGRNGRGLFSSNELTTSEPIFILGKKDLDGAGKTLYQSCGIKSSFWLRDELGPSKAWLGGGGRPCEQKHRKAEVFPAMLLQAK